MRALLAKLKSGTEHLNYGREIMAAFARAQCAGLSDSPLRLLDLGLGTGADLENVRAALAPSPVELNGADSHGPNIRAASARGIGAVLLDLERDALPFADASIDLVLANQVLEHAKEIFWITAEAARVLKPGGAFLVGVPNLASLHSRVMLALGMQPSPVDVLGPHVRAFTRGGFKGFIEAGGFFKVVEMRGGNFYPLLSWLARPAARLLPGLSVSLFFRCERTGRSGSFLEVLDQRFFETPFYRGPKSP